MKNPAYAKIKHLLESGYITEFSQLFEDIPKKTVYKDLKMGFQAFDRRLDDTSRFTLRELSTLASLIGTEPLTIIALALKRGHKK